jgi:hypothetical protein
LNKENSGQRAKPRNSKYNMPWSEPFRIETLLFFLGLCVLLSGSHGLSRAVSSDVL